MRRPDPLYSDLVPFRAGRTNYDASAKFLGDLQYGLRRHAVADEPHIEIAVRHELQGMPDGSMNPNIFIPERSAAKKRQEHDIRHAAFGVEHGRQHSRLVSGFQDETCRSFPMRRRYRRLVCNRKCGAKDLGDEGSILSYGFGRLHITMYADT